MNHKRHPVVFLMPVLLFGSLMTLNLMGCNNAPVPAPGVEVSVLPQVEVSKLKQMFPETVGKGKPVVVDFYSKFCFGCQQLSPKLEKAITGNPGVTLTTLDIQKGDAATKEISMALGVTTAPYVLFIDGEGNIKNMFLEDVPAEEVDKAVQAIAPAKAE